MSDILHMFTYKAAPEKVFDAVGTVDGFKNWWTQDTKGGTGTGDTITFGFEHGAYQMPFKVEKNEASKALELKCIGGEGHPWEGTRITMELVPNGEYTSLRFAHRDFKAQDEMFMHINSQWAVYLMSLKDYLEKGAGNPHPNDILSNPRP